MFEETLIRKIGIMNLWLQKKIGPTKFCSNCQDQHQSNTRLVDRYIPNLFIIKLIICLL